MQTITKFKKGDKVLYENMPSTIVDVHYYMQTKNGKTAMILVS